MSVVHRLPELRPLDGRLNAVRPDLADSRLRDWVEASRFVEGRPARVTVPTLAQRKAPRRGAGMENELLLGEDVLVFERRAGEEGAQWAWAQTQSDGYVGWVEASGLGEAGGPFSHVVTVPRSFLYPGPDLRLPAEACLSLGSRVAVTGMAETRGTAYAVLAGGGAVIARHLTPTDTLAPDPVAVAASLLGTPYLWGGASGFGLDCSGLVQLAFRMTGGTVLRDADMQAATIGEPVEPGDDLELLRRGDLAFWKGHVGFVEHGAESGQAPVLLHASGHDMMVCREPLAEAVERIARLYDQPIGFRRP